MSDNPSKLMVPHMEETNFPVWHPAMEACLRQLGVFHIITGKRKEPEVPDYALPTPASGTATVPIAAVTLTREERALNAQLKSVCKRKQNKSKDRQETAASDILAHLFCSQHTHIADCHNDPAVMWETIRNVHMQQVPDTHFSMYNNLSSIVKGPEHRQVLPLRNLPPKPHLHLSTQCHCQGRLCCQELHLLILAQTSHQVCSHSQDLIC
jgi:hypothetical protein